MEELPDYIDDFSDGEVDERYQPIGQSQLGESNGLMHVVMLHNGDGVSNDLSGIPFSSNGYVFGYTARGYISVSYSKINNISGKIGISGGGGVIDVCGKAVD